MGKLPKSTKTKTFYGKRWYRVGSAAKKKTAKDMIGLWVDGQYRIVKVQPTNKRQKTLYTVYAKKKKQSMEKHH